MSKVEFGMDPASMTARERAQVTRANASGARPVVFVHGLWLLPSSWDRWAELFEQNGYVALTPGWPDDPETVVEANAQPEILADKAIGKVADHFEDIIRGLDPKPVVIGHSFGGLVSEILAGRGLAAASVVIAPVAFRGVLPLPLSVLKSSWPVLHNLANRHRAIPLTFEQFRFGFANAVSEEEAARLHQSFAVPAPGLPIFQAAAANINPWTEASVDLDNADRGPLLIVSGQEDNTVPPSICDASFKLQQRNPGVTEIVHVPDRGHSITIDDGWREVAETTVQFVRRFA